MLTFLDAQIGLVERESGASNAAQTDDLIALHLTALDCLESHISPGGVHECDRPLVSFFQRWLAAAGRIKQMARVVRSSGGAVRSYDHLLRGMNRAKPIAYRFDYFVELNARLPREEEKKSASR